MTGQDAADGVGVIGGLHAWPLLRAGEWSASPIVDDVDDVGGALVYIEPEFGPSVLGPVQHALDGRLDGYATIVLDRDHRTAYLYLTELHRRGLLPGLPPLHLFDFIADETEASRAHNEREVRRLTAHLERVFGGAVTDEGVRRGLDDEARLSRALIDLQRARLAGDVDGADAKALLASRRTRSVEDLVADVSALPGSARATGPRVLIVPQDSAPGTGLHELVHDAGGHVVDEEDWHGSRSIGLAGLERTGRVAADVVELLMSAPATDGISPTAALMRWYVTRIASGEIDMIAAFTSPDDQRRGWEIPHRRRLAHEFGVPFLWIHEDLASEAGLSRARAVLAEALTDLRRGGRS